ncbi:hypothetical protein [Streptomyces scabiei]|uniref:hypothetical protein n=1 Tax=Streptomyces scabiei TaxID=1930 RepID=UPI0004E65AA5|nr:hypothetical protein [Streptomyces scabiei]KFG08125.1 hypothetical protein IQ61_15420 [Streptomyces scabiei]MDX3681395.1 hypothetical protein [Streptomyces scabiei]
MTTNTTDQNAPETRTLHSPNGWTLPYLEPSPQDCTTNHAPEHATLPLCTDTAVWKVVELYDLHATLSFWCDSHLPDEHRPATAA